MQMGLGQLTAYEVGREKVKKFFRRRSRLESHAVDGNSPVFETRDLFGFIQSSMGHAKPCGNIAGPSAKAKYTKTPIVN